MKEQDESCESAERYRASYAVPHGFRQARHEPPIKFQCARPKNDHSNKAGEVCKYIIGSAGKRHGPRPILKDPSKPSLIRSKSPFACSIYDEIKMSIASLSITPFSS